MKFLRTVSLDVSDEKVFPLAAKSDEWALTGTFAFVDSVPEDLSKKERLAFRNGWLGTNSFGRATFALIKEISNEQYELVVLRLGEHIYKHYGAPNLITGSDVTYGGGGGGGGFGSSSPKGTGGAGGGGNAGSTPSGNGSPGTVNTGGGGGGGSTSSSGRDGGNGGPGIVIARAPGTACLSIAPGTNSVATLPAPAGGCKVATFTVSGTLTIG